MLHRGVLKTMRLLVFFRYFFGYHKSIAIFLFTLFGWDQHKMSLINYFGRLLRFDYRRSGSWWCVLKFWFFYRILIFRVFWLVEVQSQLVGDNSCGLGFKWMRARAWGNEGKFPAISRTFWIRLLAEPTIDVHVERLLLLYRSFSPRKVNTYFFGSYVISCCP